MSENAHCYCGSGLSQKIARLELELYQSLRDWAVERWEEEVKNRPMCNIHRRTLDDTWRQVIRKFGGDAEALLGPNHDALLNTKVTENDE